jgi:hypothetical protein
VRIASDIWVKAYLRRCTQAGAGCVLERRGDGARGAIYIKVIGRDGRVALFSPAPAGLTRANDERRWQPPAAARSEPEIDAMLAREVGFDPDLWILAVEDGAGRHFLDDWLTLG